MNPHAKEALRTLGRIGARAVARAVTEVVASATDDVEDLVDVGKEMADDFIEDIRERLTSARSRMPREGGKKRK